MSVTQVLLNKFRVIFRLTQDWTVIANCDITYNTRNEQSGIFWEHFILPLLHLA